MKAAMTPGGDLQTAAPSHHLSDDMLLDYAAGSLDEATSLIVATHLTYCPACRKRAAKLDALGGAMLHDVPPARMSAGALDAVMARLDATPHDAPARNLAPANDNPKVPSVLRRYLGGDLDDVTWKNLGMGVQTSEIALSSQDGAAADKRAFLLRVPAGKAVPHHTHDGNEYVLILRGAYNDEIGHFGRGDLAISDASIRHKPVAEPGEDCICLVVVDAPIRLTGPLGAILNLFVKV